MTADDVLEAMAREVAEAATRTPWGSISLKGRQQWVSRIRAAIRAAQEVGAILVAEMPESRRASMFWKHHEVTEVDGWNAALAAVRAKAVTP